MHAPSLPSLLSGAVTISLGRRGRRGEQQHHADEMEAQTTAGRELTAKTVQQSAECAERGRAG